MKKFGRIILLLIVAVAFVPTAQATWGDLDQTFGFFGLAVDNIAEHYPGGIAVQSDGKILVTGYKIFAGRQRFFLRRYLASGQPDTSFGNNGSAIANAPVITNSDYYGSRILVQADGRIVVAGRGDSRPTIWRFLSSGSADTTLAVGGMKVLYAYEGSSSPAIATYSNILYVGVIDDQTASTRIIKFHSNGSQDTSFGTSGEAVTDAGSEYSLGVDPTSGNVFIGGRRRSNIVDIGVERFLPTGAPDPAFTQWGATYNTWLFNSYRVLRKANGSFVMNERWYNITGGGTTVGSNLVRLNSVGSFTSRSVYESANTLAYTCPDVMAEQQDGKVILKGASGEHLYRYAANFLTIQTNSCSSFVSLSGKTEAVLQPDDKMVTAGRYNGSIGIIRTIP
jgi:uncharacterized delta-60 repeat protein